MIKKWFSITIITISSLLTTTITPNKPTIIVLQGFSSSGKSSTAQELQNLYAQDNKPFMYLAMDGFLSTLPKKWLNYNSNDTAFSDIADDGIRFIKTKNNDLLKSTIVVVVGKTVLNAITGMVNCIYALAQCDNNIIFEGSFKNSLFKGLEPLKEKYTVYFIKIECDLDVMKKREIQRAGIIGLTQCQHQDPEFHYDNYDLVVDTSNITPTDAAQHIKSFINAQQK